MRKKLFELKTELKGKAKKIKTDRQEHKTRQRAGNSGLDWELYKMSRDFRHHHIAYCELRGRTRNTIELPREGNEPNEKEIKKIKDEYKEECNEQEALRISA